MRENYRTKLERIVRAQREAELRDGEGVPETVRIDATVVPAPNPNAKVVYDPTTPSSAFVVGMIFQNVAEFRKALNKYAVNRGVELTRMNQPKSGLLAKRRAVGGLCYREFKVRHSTQKFLVDYFKDRITNFHHLKAKELKARAMKELKMDVTEIKCKRVKAELLKELQGDYLEEYGLLWNYREELLLTNTGSTVEVLSIGNNPGEFGCMYMCFDALKKGWKAGCKPIIGLDGCFLKTICKGELLITIGRDANNQIFPISWTVVRTKSKATWRWFLNHLKQDFNLGDGSKLTLISLLPAIKEEFHEAEHRWCAQHIFMRWQKRWNGGDFRKQFWMCARSTFEESFQDQLEDMDALVNGSIEHLLTYPTHTWCNAYFRFHSKCDSVDNNMCESFNGDLLAARKLHILGLL
ncbi:uncharacterized protein LOC126668213 [Mercurialis annua]|uniref:uncharacterized protein LOC126668213 n=1 Tax=Mercurialis annua TaxID=3986 RepID=UPI002160AE85|nr:uncharacterized protein LOC126668213 [Mercurialis annua]